MTTTPVTEPTTTWEQIGEGGWAISRQFGGRSFTKQTGWKLWTPSVHGPGGLVVAERCEWDYRGTWRERRMSSLADLKTDAEGLTGVSACDWVKNQMGDYVSKQVAKARPLRRVGG